MKPTIGSNTTALLSLTADPASKTIEIKKTIRIYFHVLPCVSKCGFRHRPSDFTICEPNSITKFNTRELYFIAAKFNSRTTLVKIWWHSVVGFATTKNHEIPMNHHWRSSGSGFSSFRRCARAMFSLHTKSCELWIGLLLQISGQLMVIIDNRRLWWRKASGLQ